MLGAQEKADLEEFLSQSRARETDLAAAATAASEEAAQARSEARAMGEEASAARRKAEGLDRDASVLQQTMKSMRAECTERFVHEQAAVGKLTGLEQKLADAQARGAELRTALDAASAKLSTQEGVNRQLMAKKEEVEWQLMSALAQKHSAGKPEVPPPPPSGNLVTGPSYLPMASLPPLQPPAAPFGHTDRSSPPAHRPFEFHGAVAADAAHRVALPVPLAVLPASAAVQAGSPSGPRAEASAGSVPRGGSRRSSIDGISLLHPALAVSRPN